MEYIGKLRDAIRNVNTGNINVTFEFNDANFEDFEELQKAELKIKIEKHKHHRSLNANKFLWEMLSTYAAAAHKDKWCLYLEMIGKYGKSTLIAVTPEAVDDLKAVWRETKVLGPRIIEGKEMVEVLCYFGSSTYNTKEFADLLEGIAFEMKQDGVQPPPTAEMRRYIEAWEKQHQ